METHRCLEDAKCSHTTSRGQLVFKYFYSVYIELECYDTLKLSGQVLQRHFCLMWKVLMLSKSAFRVYARLPLKFQLHIISLLSTAHHLMPRLRHRTENLGKSCTFTTGFTRTPSLFREVGHTLTEEKKISTFPKVHFATFNSPS